MTNILRYQGLHRVEVEEALAGDIVSIAGIDNVKVGSTLASPEHPEVLPLIKIDEPTISMNFSHNTSPLSGKDGGRFLTSRHIRERLEHEAMINVGIGWRTPTAASASRCRAAASFTSPSSSRPCAARATKWRSRARA